MNHTLPYDDIKSCGSSSGNSYLSSSQKVTRRTKLYGITWQLSRRYVVDFNNDFLTPCPDRICSECGNDHSFKNNFEDVKTSIDALPELFPKYFKRTSISNNNKSKEFTN